MLIFCTQSNTYVRTYIKIHKNLIRKDRIDLNTYLCKYVCWIEIFEHLYIYKSIWIAFSCAILCILIWNWNQKRKYTHVICTPTYVRSAAVDWESAHCIWNYKGWSKLKLFSKSFKKYQLVISSTYPNCALCECYWGGGSR